MDGFKKGFPLGYDGPKENIRRFAPNLKLEVGSELELWNKVMKEVKLGRYAGPYLECDIPFDNFIQSPIGLVPKDNGKDTRLIFHLSYPRGEGISVNGCTPEDICKVKYPDFNDAVKLCMEVFNEAKRLGIEIGNNGIAIGKSDMKSAFRNLGMKKSDFCWMLMKARNPIDNQWYFFLDKCLPFGSSISCKHFQDFSDSVAHIFRITTGRNTVNYLDDYLFAAIYKQWCDNQIRKFLDICEEINFPVSLEKTFWSVPVLTFLGLLIDTIRRRICIPVEKVDKAKQMINYVIQKKKVTLQDLQSLCGFLNFLCKAIVPGRAFTRRLYSYTASKEKSLKPHHHIWINKEMRDDLQVWQIFLQSHEAYSRPFMDFSSVIKAKDINFFMDASKSLKLGFGGICGRSWMWQKWSRSWLENEDPSIEFLELFALTAGALSWMGRFKNSRIILHTDNDGAKFMVNSGSAKCKQCMKLIRLLTLESIANNVRIYCKYVKSKDNVFADALSRLQFDRFHREAAKRQWVFERNATPPPEAIWPVERIWNRN